MDVAAESLASGNRNRRLGPTSVLYFLLGVFLPFVTLSRTATLSEEAVSVWTRILPVDVVLVLVLFTTALQGYVRTFPAYLLYLLCLCASLVIGTLVGGFDTTLLTGFLVIFSAALYIQAGFTASRNRAWLQALLLGVCAGALLEWMIVALDFFFHAGLFPLPDASDAMVRGTFRNKNQLGGYGYSIIGLLLAFGWSVFSSKTARRWIIWIGAIAFLFPFASGRRGTLIVCAGWLMIVVVGILQRKKHAWFGALTLLLTLGIAVLFGMNIFLESGIGQHLQSGVQKLGSEDSFPMLQLAAALRRYYEWFPFGIGFGRGKTYDPFGVYEIHNGHLALIVEGGLHTLLSFYLLIATAILWVRRATRERFWSGSELMRTRLRLALPFFLFSGYALMYHGILHRDRGFLLLLGLVVGASMESCAGRAQFWRRE